MNIVTAFQDIGRPIAYYPDFNKITGDVKATILLCQLMHWDEKQRDENGWICKTQSDLENETGLSRYEQENARRKLKRNNLISEERKGIPAKLYFKLNVQNISSAWEKSMNRENHKNAENPQNI
jgi:hypothetical protein